MQQGGGQGSEGRHPSSPRGGGGGNLPKFSLLGQQLTSYSQQNTAPPANMGFSLGVHPQQQQVQNQQSHSQAFSQAQNMNSGGGNERGYANFLQNMTNPAGPSFNANNNQNTNTNNMPNFINQLQASQAIPNLQSSPEAIMNGLSMLQQRIGQLQAIVVPYLAAGQAQVGANSQAQVMSQAQALTQLTQLAAIGTMLGAGPGPAPQQNPAVPNQQQQQGPLGNNFPGPPNNQQQQQQLNVNEIIQHLGESIPPPQAYNFFQQQGGGGSSSLGQQGLPSMNNLPMGNNFAAMQGGGGNNPLAGPLVGQSLIGNLGGVFGCEGGSSSPSPGQNLRNKELGSVLNKQIGNGIARNTLGTSGGGRVESSVMSNQPSHQSMAGGSPSQLEDDGSRRRSRGDEDDDGEGEKLDPSEYELIEMDAMEILAEHTHFCEICGKGFKRDANLRMHMRGHGDEYKTPAALARPDKAAHDQAAVKERRYSCPYAGCKRNKKHRKFAPLKTMLCVKNHYRRSHCPKMLACQKCKSKKFSVVADLKTHEKHCGCDKWQCSCGTTFSRKDKLLGHIALFAGHTPAVPLGDVDNVNSHRELDSIDLSSPNQNNLAQQQQSVNSSGYNIGGNSGISSGMISGLSSGMGSGGNGSGIGHVIGPGGMHGRLADESNVGSDTPASSSYSSGGQGLLPPSSMLSGLFTSNFLQGSTGGNSSSDCLH